MKQEMRQFSKNTQEKGQMILDRLFPLIGCTHLSYVYETKNQRYAYCANQEWFDYYWKHGLFELDPIRVVADGQDIKCVRWDALSGKKEHNDVMAERNRFCGIHSGFSFVFEDQGTREIISVATDIKRYPIYDAVSKKLPVLHRARALLRGCADLDVALNDEV